MSEVRIKKIGENSKTSATSSTKSQAVSFTAEEICAIIRECRGLANVDLDYNNLKISYRPQGPGDAAYQSQIAGVAENEQRSSEIPAQWREQAKFFDEQALQDADESQVIIESPFDYEQAQIDYHIERNRGIADGRKG